MGGFNPSQEWTFFAFEHLMTASSWEQACVQRVQALPGVQQVDFDQRMLGLNRKVSEIPMRKRTRILTNMPALVHLLRDARCDGAHPHQVIQGSEGGCKRSTWAQCYPAGLVNILVTAASLQREG